MSHGYFLTPFLHKFIIQIVIHLEPSSSEYSAIDIGLDINLFDLESADDVGLLSEDSSELYFSLGRPNDGIRMFGMHLPSSECKMLLQDWVVSKPNLVLTEEQVDEVDRFSYLGNCITPGGSITDGVSSRGSFDWHAAI